MKQINQSSADAWGAAGAQEAFSQVADMCQRGLSLDLAVAPDGSSFHSKSGERKPQSGVLSASGKLGDDSLIVVQMELIRASDNLRVPSGAFFKHLAGIGEKVSLLPPREEANGQVSLWVELKVKPSPMAMARASAFLDQVKQLDALARFLQAELPVLRAGTDLLNLYKDFAEALEPVNPLSQDEIQSLLDLLAWAREVEDFLAGSSSVAVASPFPIAMDLALAILAAVLMEAGSSLGELLLPAINSRGLLELARKAPGIVVVSAVRLSLGTNPYDLGNEMQALLSALSSAGKPVVFTGTLDQLQAIFAGGQGAKSEPLSPVVRHVPDLPVDTLARFAIRAAGHAAGGLPEKTEAELAAKTLECIRHMSPAEQMRILPVVVRRIVRAWAAGNKAAVSSSKAFASMAGKVSETLSGLSPHPRVSRRPEVQENFTRVLTDPALLPFLRENLLAQDPALEQLVSRLVMESLTRPPHQPIRYCAQGTPATGKSESAVLLAERLGVPYVNIDAASMPDYYTASSQLLGSGRGIVMSYQSGRLEQVARHHAGALLEVSDLDHAPAGVRSVLADLFLQVLETGEAQSATGAMFSCANVIFAFTMNLPAGMDESVRKGIGFGGPPTKREVNSRVVSEIKSMLSSAFVSRIGTPILFEPLDGDSLALILERAVKRAILSAAERLHVAIMGVELAAGLGARLIASLESGLASWGARALLEHGRSLAAKAFVELHQTSSGLEGKVLHASATDEGVLSIKTA